MLPFITFLPILYALGYLLGAFLYGPLGIPGSSWYGITLAAVAGIGLTALAIHFRIASRYWFKSDR